jgi:hypothetical protein
MFFIRTFHLHWNLVFVVAMVEGTIVNAIEMEELYWKGKTN